MRFDDLSVRLVRTVSMAVGAGVIYECGKLIAPESSQMHSRTIRMLDYSIGTRGVQDRLSMCSVYGHENRCIFTTSIDQRE